nr:hypothetical protein CFP56_00310 [Quercus suber]
MNLLTVQQLTVWARRQAGRTASWASQEAIAAIAAIAGYGKFVANVAAIALILGRFHYCTVHIAVPASTMGVFKGGALRLFQTFLYLLAFCCAAIILGIFSYFLAVLADRDQGIQTQWKAVEGLSGAATLYLIFAVLLTCCLGGISFLAFLAIVLDVLFCGAMIAIAVLTRHGASSCRGVVNTPLGIGAADTGSGFGANGSGTFGSSGNDNVTYRVRYGTACRLNTACFAVSIVGAILFLITAAVQVLLVRSHKKEKRFGPSPSNNYTSGYGKKRSLFSRNKKDKNLEKDNELGMTGAAVGAGGLAAGHPDTRPSHETGYTGSTVAGTTANDKLDSGVPPTHSTHGGYYTQPQGTGVNPYGYGADTNTTTHTTTTGPVYTTGTATNY